MSMNAIFVQVLDDLSLMSLLAKTVPLSVDFACTPHSVIMTTSFLHIRFDYLVNFCSFVNSIFLKKVDNCIRTTSCKRLIIK